jgi:hypothetical protein
MALNVIECQVHNKIHPSNTNPYPDRCHSKISFNPSSTCSLTTALEGECKINHVYYLLLLSNVYGKRKERMER